jgi:hypothetical protein
MSLSVLAQPRVPRAAFGKIVRNEARLAWRQPSGLIVGVGISLALLIIFGEIPVFRQSSASLGGLADQGRPQPDRAADRPGSGPAAATVCAGRTVLAPGPPGHLVRPRAGRTAGAVRAPAARRDRRPPSALRQRGQRRGDLAHCAAAARPPARRPPLPVRILGGPRRRKPWSAATRAGSSRGCPRRAEPNGPLSPRTAYRGPATASICGSGW